MALFKKKTEPVAVRRRPLAEPETARRGEVFSYHSRRSASQSNTGRLDAAAIQAAQAEPADKPTGPRWVLWSIAVGILAAFLVLTSLGGSTHVTIESGDGSQYFLQNTSVYQQAVATDIGSSFLNRNKITFDTVKLRQDIKHEYPEIKTVDVKLPLIGGSPTVVLTPYKADYILTTVSGGSFVVDEAGHAVISTSQLPNQNSLHLPLLVDKSGRSISLNSQAIASTTVAFADQVRSVLAAQHVTAMTLTLPADTSELDVAINGAPYSIKFNLQGDPRLQTGTFLAAKRTLDKDHNVPAQYVDVRVPGRVYYK